MNSYYEEFKDLSKKEINEAFLQFCLNDDLDRVRYLVNSSELRFNANPHYEDDLAFKMAFSRDHLEIIKFLANPKEIKKPINISPYAIRLTEIAAKQDDIDSIEEFLPIAINHAPTALSIVMEECCNTGNINIVKYFLNSPKWGEQIKKDNNLFVYACRSGNVELIDYLLHSQWKDNFDISFDNDLPFITCCEVEELEAVKYFIFSLSVPKSSDIMEYLLDEERDNIEFNNSVLELFNKRDLAHLLTFELDNDNDNNIQKRNKI
jgi:hypothetical protein